MVDLKVATRLGPLSAVIGSAFLLNAEALWAQALDEIVVTAQRREQSLQEVPISIEAYSGAEIQEQGFRDMTDLTNFSPGANIDAAQDRIDITIRGIGTAGNNQALEQSAPTFVDGIHFGRSGQILGAFLDVERVEILRGPQPVYFGQNANAGAFSIITRKPTPEWRGDLRAELGGNEKRAFEFGVGGPITDSLGIRLAGKYEYSAGFLRDLLTGKKFPVYEIAVGRAILEWTPNDSFQALAKFQIGRQRTGGDGEAVRRSVGSSMDPVPTDRYGTQTLITGLPNGNLHPVPDGFEDGWGVMPSTTFLNPSFSGVPWLPDANRTDVDLSGFLPAYLRNNPNAYGERGPDSIAAHDNLDPWDAYLDMTYTWENGTAFNSLTGFSRYERENAEDNSGHYFLSNWTFRSEYLDQFSQEFRLSSPTGGRFEWMAGVYYQDNALDLRTVSFRANVRRSSRNPFASEDATWKSAFATGTVNFFDNKFSIDIGARYTDVKKHGKQQQLVQDWIFDDGTPDGIVLPEMRHEEFLNHPIYSQFVGATPIGITPEVVPTDPDAVASNDAVFTTHQLDPQVVLRYRPIDNLSLYAKYAEAFKAGAFEIELKSTPEPENFVFGNEYATSYEAGARGSWWDGRAQGGITLFHTEIDDLQIGTSLPLAVVNAIGQNSQTVNAGRQRVRGVEFNTTILVADRLTLGLSGAMYDGIMASFENAGCTEAEVVTNQCDNLEDFTKDRTGEDAPRLPDWVFVLDANYEMPMMNDYVLSFDGLVKYSDGYLTDIESFSRVVQMPVHTDLNLAVGVGDADGTWKVSLFARHLTEPHKEYFPEFDVDPQALVGTDLSSSAFATYGLQLRYWYE